MPLIPSVNFILGPLTIAGQFLVVIFLFSLIFRKEKWLVFVSKNALLSAFIVALVATLGSLFYSEIAGYDPCKLCWFQRIFMYPQTILLGIALWKKDDKIFNYSLVLSSIGGLIAAYHYLLQIGAAPAIHCSAVGYSSSCVKEFVMQFGYITIPMMAFTAFLMVFLISIIKMKKRG